MMKNVELVIRAKYTGPTSDVVGKLAIIGALRKAAPWLDIESVKIVPLEPCECGGWKREGALMCDACAGAW
jgi:hypothetical protein